MSKRFLEILSIAGYCAMVAGLLLLLLNRGLLSPHPAVITIQIGSLLLMIWARRTFGKRSFHLAADPTAGGLVQSGPYKYVRHPIYAAVLLFTCSGIIAHPAVLNALAGVLVLIGAEIRMRCEELLVRIHYPEYDEYASRTKRLIPFIY